LFSFLLMFIAYYIRVHFQESPIFEEIKAKGAMTKNPWKEAFLSANIKFVLIATIIVLGEGVVWYSGQFWALHFLQQVTKVDALTTHPSDRVVSGMPASVHFLSADATAAMPDSRHKLRNAGRVFATNRETRNLCGEIRLKQACGRC
jgi:hypothetical protein